MTYFPFYYSLSFSSHRKPPPHGSQIVATAKTKIFVPYSLMPTTASLLRLVPFPLSILGAASTPAHPRCAQAQMRTLSAHHSRPSLMFLYAYNSFDTFLCSCLFNICIDRYLFIWCWSPPIAVSFCAFMSRGNFNGGLLESALGRQVFKIKMDESEYRTQGTNVSLN